jgi:hypothetical protein
MDKSDGVRAYEWVEKVKSSFNDELLRILFFHYGNEWLPILSE